MRLFTESLQAGLSIARAARRVWFPLVCCELVLSLVWTAALGPWLLALSYRLIELSGDSVLGNTELAQFLWSPMGISALLFGASVTLGLIWVEYALLIVWSDAGLRGASLAVGQVAPAIASIIPRLFGLAAAQTSAVILLALPFIALGMGVYWTLLGNTDINFYLTERPPRFWIAVVAGLGTAALFAALAGGLLVRWALALPACVIDGRNWLAALRTSTRLMRGRTWRLLLLIAAWQGIKYLAILVVLWGLDAANQVLMRSLSERLSLLIWSTLMLLAVESIVLQLLGAVFAIGLALLLAYEYQRAQETPQDFEAESRPASRLGAQTPHRTRRARMALAALLIAGPAASLIYAMAMAPEFVEHRATRVTAHRAGPKPAPENSLAALRLALAAGADFVELDVQPTADGKIVLAHDRDLRRVTGDPRVVTELRRDDMAILRLRDANGPTDERIPTLEEFLAACDDTIRLNVEMKDFGNAPGLGLAVLDVLRRQDFTARAVVSCFQLPPLLEIKAVDPRLPIGKIVSASQGDLTRLPVDFLSVHQPLVRGDLVRRAHRRGMQVHVWTVNDRETALRMLDLGCDNLITSHPAMVRKVVDDYAHLSDVERMVLRLRRWLRE